MARERSVTRTINVTTVNAITMNIETKNVETKAFTISGDTPSQDNALKQAKKLYETKHTKNRCNRVNGHCRKTLWYVRSRVPEVRKRT